MLKAPPVNPWDYISRTSKISPRGAVNMFEKALKKEKKVDNGLFSTKKVDKNAMSQ